MTIRYQKQVIQADTLTPISIYNRLQGEKKARAITKIKVAIPLSAPIHLEKSSVPNRK